MNTDINVQPVVDEVAKGLALVNTTATETLNSIKEIVPEATSTITSTITQGTTSLSGTLADVAQQAMSLGITGGTAIFEYLQTEVPELVTQFLLWKGCEAGAKALFYISPLILTIIFAKKWWKMHTWVEEREEKVVRECDKGTPTGLWITGGLIGGIIGAATTLQCLGDAFTSALDLVKITVAPKIYILEYLANLM